MTDIPRSFPSIPAVTIRLLRGLTYAFSLVVSGIWALVTVTSLTIFKDGLPGAGAWPLFIALAIAIGSAAGIIAEWRSGPGEDDRPLELPRGLHLRQWLVFFVVMVGFLVATPLLGFFLAGTLMMFVCNIALSVKREYLKAAILAVCVSVAVHLLFTMVFSIKMPQGILNGILN